MEIVQGKREELYWEKVPEKVRRQAVQKAISQIQMIPNGHGEEDSSTRKACNVENGTIKRKRRKQS
jgi:ribosomal protein L4